MATATRNKLSTSEGIESQTLLRDRAIRFTREIVNFDSIDLKESEQNQARFLAIHPETVELYTAAMEDGAEFPPIVIYRAKIGGKVRSSVLDGNHRIRSAMAAGFTSAEMLVVTEATEAQRELFIYEANAKHGLPTTMAERVAQGVFLVGLGNQALEVAQALGVPERKLWAAVRAKRARTRLERLGVKMNPKWSDGLLQRFGSVRSDVVIVPLIKLVNDARLSPNESEALVLGVNALPTEGAALEYLEKERASQSATIASTAGGALAVPKEINALRIGLRMFQNMDPEELAKALTQVTPEYRDALGRRTLEGVSTLITLASKFKQ